MTQLQPPQPGLIKAVALDVFGTLAEITDKRRPYLAVGRSAADPRSLGHYAMTRNLGLAGFAHAVRSGIRMEELAELEQDLYAELASVRLFPEVETVLRVLRGKGYKLAIVSNLAAPYAVPLKLLLPFELDAYAWSFERGALKPDAAIYAWTAEQLACAPREILMVGDTWSADYAGATAQGFQALHLDRKGTTPSDGAPVIADLTGILTHLGIQAE